MNSLKLINEEIEKLKAFLELDDVLCLQTDEDYKFWNKRLQTFQQIKSELEALEVVKEELQIVDKTTNQYGEPLYRYELNVIGQDKINTLEKGLEVSNNE